MIGRLRAESLPAVDVVSILTPSQQGQHGGGLGATTPRRIHENFEISALPEDAMQEIRDKIAERVRFNVVVETGVPGFIPQGR